jgi:cysteine synthase
MGDALAMQMGIVGHIGGTPLVTLGRIGRGLPVPLLAKCEHMNPGGSIKDRIARAIVDDAEARGVLRPGMTLVEATAGNTGVGLALVAASRGYGLVCVMPEKMSVDKRVALAGLGARVVVTVNAPPSSPDNFRNVARRMAEAEGWFLTDQFCNPANVRAHWETTGAEILAQTDGRVAAFVAGAGTGGTLSGVGGRLKAHNPAVRVILADPVGSALADWVETGVLGADGSYAVEGIGGSEAPDNLHREHDRYRTTSTSPVPAQQEAVLALVAANPVDLDRHRLARGLLVGRAHPPVLGLHRGWLRGRDPQPRGRRAQADGYSDPEDASGYSAHDILSLGFKKSPTHAALLEDTKSIEDVTRLDYDAVFVAGGQSPMFTFRGHASCSASWRASTRPARSRRWSATPPACCSRRACRAASCW